MPKQKSQLLRLIFIDKQIREGMKTGKLANCTSMAADYEVSKKSILRDIDYLKNQLDAPLEYNTQKRGYYYTENNYSLPALHINESDLFAICIAEKALRQHENTPIYLKLKSIFQKISKSLPEKISIDPAWIDTRFSVIQDHATQIDSEVWETIAHSLSRNHTLQISYKKPGAVEPSARPVDPYHVLSYQGEWYMMGFCHERKKILTFAVSRISKAVQTDRSFELNNDFRIEDFVGRQFGIFQGNSLQKVTVLFSADLAPYVEERKWHPEQKMKKNADHSLTLSLQASHLREVKRWILSWGSGAKVIEPKELVDAIRMEHETAYKQYTQKKPET